MGAPPALAARFEAVADDPAAVRALGIEQAILLASDCSPSLHFLTFNTARATRQVLGVGEAATDRFDDDDAAVHVHGFDAPGENPVRVVW
jgi:Methylenetetrahydrofolate reductase